MPLLFLKLGVGLALKIEITSLSRLSLNDFYSLLLDNLYRGSSLIKHLHIIFFLFSCLILSSPDGYAFSERYSLSLNTGYSTIIGKDNTYPKVNIATPLYYGLNFDFHYAEDTPFSSYIGLTYRTMKYLNDSKNNINIANQGQAHDLGLKYDLYSKIFNDGRLITGVRYMNFYYFQSNPLGYIDVKSGLGMIARVGLDYVFYKQNKWTVSAQGLTGYSIVPAMKNGYANEIEAKASYKLSNDFTYLVAFSYSEFLNKTDNSSITIESDQARVDLNLKLGLEKVF